MVVLLQVFNELCEEPKGGWRSDIGWTLFTELGELIVEGWSHLWRQALHDVLHQVLGEGNAVKIFLVVKVLHPNKQKPVKNTRLFGLFHTSDPSLYRDNSRVVQVIVDDLINGLGPSFYMAKT